MDETLLEKFKAFAYPGKSNLLGSVAFRPADSELTRTLEVAKALVLRMLGKSVTTLNLPVDATRSLGTVTITKDNANTIITIPINTAFMAQDLTFENLEEATIDEAQSFINLPVQSVGTGLIQNIQAGQTWDTAIVGVTVTNTSPFTGGADEYGDFLIQEAVFFLAKYFLQNRQFYDFNREIDVNVISEREIQKYETELSGAVYRHVIGLISHARNPSDFIPTVG